ncbi:MAG: MauE/DoxX family redox-associated membrane protein [Melioribacteraceae bacterium]|nr:MauE/DoxX family redox-associated membrane protein [Melioribacteraceae bacterium]
MGNATLKSLTYLLRIGLGIIFFTSGILKLIDIYSFQNAISNFNLLPVNIIPVISISIAIIETSLAILLITNYKTKIVASIFIYILVSFTTLVLFKFVEGVKIACGCFGDFINSEINIWTILRNIFLLVLMLIIKSNADILDKKISLTISDIILEFKNNIYNYFVLSTFILLSIFYLGTLQQNNQLKKKLDQLVNIESVLKENDVAPPFKSIDMLNKEYKVKYNSGYDFYLLYIFSTNCETCNRNFQTWINLKDSLLNKSIYVFSVSTDLPKRITQYLQNKRVNFEVYSSRDEDFIKNYKSTITPQTILINKKGLVMKTWI